LSIRCGWRRRGLLPDEQVKGDGWCLLRATLVACRQVFAMNHSSYEVREDGEQRQGYKNEYYPPPSQNTSSAIVQENRASCPAG
jgi:hypothetical protein